MLKITVERHGQRRGDEDTWDIYIPRAVQELILVAMGNPIGIAKDIVQKIDPPKKAEDDH